MLERSIDITKNNIDDIHFPIIDIRKLTYFGEIPVNSFGLAISLFMLSLPLLEWLDFNSPIFAVTQIFGGICEYIFGIFNWYQGKTILCFIDFIFGLLHLLIYYSFEFCKYEIIRVDQKFESYLIGAFFTLYLVILITLLIASKDKAILFKINLGILIVSNIFILAWQYRYNKDNIYNSRLKTIVGFLLFFAAFTIWFMGAGNFINETFKTELIPMLKPNLKKF